METMETYRNQISQNLQQLENPQQLTIICLLHGQFQRRPLGSTAIGAVHGGHQGGQPLEPGRDTLTHRRATKNNL